MGLPAGATLVSGSLPDASQLPPGATLVSGDLPTAAQPGLLDKANEYAGKALSAAGLPTSISNVPDWFKHLTGTHPNSEPFWEPVRRAIKDPTQENIVAAVPFIGPSSVAMSKDVQAGNYGGAAATLAGTVGSVVGPAKAPEIAAGLSDTTHAIAQTPGAIADAAQNGLRDPITGKLKPGVKTAAKVVGGVVGAVPGALHGNLPAAYIGGEAGARTLPAIVDAATPVSAAQKQLAADAAAMRTRNLQARIAESKAAEASGQTITEYRAAQRAAAKAKAAPATPEASPIVAQDAAPSEGRPATWRDFSGGGKVGVADLSRSGGPLAFDAATQAKLRQLDVPNVGMVADPRATAAPTLNAPKSVTLFDAQGNPVPTGGVDAMAETMAKKPKQDFAYRVRPEGQEGVPIKGNSHAHATTSLDEAKDVIKPGLESLDENEGKTMETVKYDLSKLKEGVDYVRVPRPGKPDWIRQLRPLEEHELQPVKAQ